MNKKKKHFLTHRTRPETWENMPHFQAKIKPVFYLHSLSLSLSLNSLSKPRDLRLCHPLPPHSFFLSLPPTPPPLPPTQPPFSSLCKVKVGGLKLEKRNREDESYGWPRELCHTVGTNPLGKAPSYGVRCIIIFLFVFTVRKRFIQYLERERMVFIFY